MPRETITSASKHGVPLDIEVTWSRGLFGQLGLVSRDGTTFKEWVASWNDEDYDSVWADLDEAAVDRLLKVLRRVKRQLAEAPDREKDEAYRRLK